MWNGMELVRPVSADGRRALLVQVAVAELTGVELVRICTDKRGHPRAATARQMAMYLCHLVFDMNASSVGRLFGRDRRTVRYALQRIEDLREDPELDRTLAWLEASLRRTGGRA